MDVTHMVVFVVGGLAVFLFGMKVMSEGLQKVAGERMRAVLSAMTSNRFAGVGTGLLVTAVIQSSSATTVMLVGFVNAGLITFNQSVGVIMGANIGTTMTAWLVALIGFKFHISSMALPAIAIGFLPRLLGFGKASEWGEVLIGFGILFLGLDFMKEAVSDLKDAPQVISWIAGCRADLISWRLIAVGVGLLITVIIQSSSASMAVTMTMAAQGIIDMPTACAIALGQNIGTTITANLAAIGTSTTAKQSARAHTLFNLIGSIWPIIFFQPLLSFIDLIVPGAHSAGASEALLASYLATFHTTFNVVNTLAFLPFINQLGWLSAKLVWGKKQDDSHLKFLDPKLMNSPPMALHAARMELGHMLAEVEKMLTRIRVLISTPNKKMGKVADEILSSEQVVDMLEKEITEYLVSVTQLETSLEQSQEIAGLIHSVSDIERMGDHCESIVKLLMRRYDHKLEFTDDAIKELTDISEKVCEFVNLLLENLDRPSESVMPRAKIIEKGINEMRKRMRNKHIKRLQSGSCDVGSGLIFIDILTSFEKMGDHSFNIAQMLGGER